MRPRQRPRTQIFSIFGQIEEVAAKIMMDKGKIILHIPREQIPEEAMYNKDGATAKFAIMIDTKLVPEFENLIRELLK